jgi:U3 small nucleolar RNA-associated protein 13
LLLEGTKPFDRFVAEVYSVGGVEELIPYNMAGRVWKEHQRFDAFYTGGAVHPGPEGSLYCLSGGSVKQVSVPDFSVVKTFEIENEEFNCLAVTADSTLITSSQHNLLRLWTEPPQVWRSDCTVLLMAVKDSLLATGGSDGSVRVFQLGHAYLTHCFRQHKGLILALAFLPDDLRLVTSSNDYCLKVFDLATYTCMASVNTDERISSIAVYNQAIYTGSRDQTLKTWTYSLKLKQQITTKKEVEAVVVGDNCLVVAQTEGVLTKHSLKSLKLLKERNILGKDLTSLQVLPSGQLLATNSEYSLLFLSPKLKVQQEICGYFDEIYDLRCSDDGKHVAIASNSELLKVLDVEKRTIRSLEGHTDFVLCIDILGDLIVSGSKDNTVRLWKDCSLIATYAGHTSAVTGVALSKKKFVVSGSKDQTLKVWAIGTGDISESLSTVKAHDKELNAVKVSPDGKRIASASHDRSIKLWNKRLQEMMVLKGHKRGVWDIEFCKYDALLASVSGDMTAKLWSLHDGTCVRTYEGHQNSVLKVRFIADQLATAGGEGLIKVWNVNSGVCTSTMEVHEDRVWAITTTQIDGKIYLLSGGADSVLTMWADFTTETSQEQLTDKQALIAQEQQLENCIHTGQQVEAAIIAFKLKRPRTFFKVLGSLSPAELTGVVDRIIEDEDLEELLTQLRDFNTHSKHAATAQTVLKELFERVTSEKFSSAQHELLQTVLLYSRKHYARVVRLLQKTYSIKQLLSEMNVLGAPEKRQKTSID